MHFLCRISQDDYDDGDGWKADHFYSEEDRSTIAEEVNKVEKELTIILLDRSRPLPCQLLSESTSIVGSVPITQLTKVDGINLPKEALSFLVFEVGIFKSFKQMFQLL